MTDEWAIQVCAKLTSANSARELVGLRQACALPGQRKALVVTMDQTDRLNASGLEVEVVPAWAWLDPK